MTTSLERRALTPDPSTRGKRALTRGRHTRNAGDTLSTLCTPARSPHALFPPRPADGTGRKAAALDVRGWSPHWAGGVGAHRASPGPQRYARFGEHTVHEAV